MIVRAVGDIDFYIVEMTPSIIVFVTDASFVRCNVTVFVDIEGAYTDADSYWIYESSR